jgi:predicted AlkP superfamily phosphohydrolase/phosphomutase
LAPENVNSRVLIIGLEGATWRTLTPAVEMGYMPFLRHLVNRGSSGTLFSTTPSATATAWAALQTGRNPGSTGVFSSTIFDRASHTTAPVDSASIGRTIWDQVGRSERRVAVLNVPLTWPPRPINGVLVAGHTPPSAAGITWPAELSEELEKAFPEYALSEAQSGTTPSLRDDLDTGIEQACRAVQDRTMVAEHIIFTRSPDLCMVHFHASDILQHALWCYLDPADPLYDETRQLAIFERFYGCLDQAIKDTCDAFTRAASGEVSVFVISDHGFEMHRKRFNLAAWLTQQELMHPAAGSDRPSPARKSLMQRLLVLFGLGRQSQEDGADTSNIPQPVDWSTSPTFLLGDGGEAGIYILSEDDAHRRNAITRVTKGLKAIRDPFTSAPIVHGVFRKEEIYAGPKMDLMPDLVVVPAAGYSFSCRCTADSALIEDVKPDTDRYLGKHQTDGIIVACGPGIADKIGITANLVDVAPTILYCLGLDIPANYDGKVAMDLFTEDFVTSRGQPRIKEA